VIVDLFGPSGSGKSYLASRLAAQHDLPLVRVRFGQKYFFALLFASHYPRLVARLLRLWQDQTRDNRVLRGEKLLKLISFLAKEQKARWLGGGVIDEGIFQYFLILHEGKISPPEIEDCLALLPADGYRICIVETDLATRFTRMQARGKVSRWELGEAYTKHWQDILETNAAALKPILMARYACEIQRND
jgi:hypothetical protein